MSTIYVCDILNIPFGCERTFWISEQSILGNPFTVRSNSEWGRAKSAAKQYFWDVHRLALEETIDPTSIATEFKVVVNPAWKRLTAQEILGELARILMPLKAGKDVALLCFGDPARSHGDVLADYLRWRLSENSVGFPPGFCSSSFAEAS